MMETFKEATDKSNKFRTSLIDFRKAFECIDHGSKSETALVLIVALLRWYTCGVFVDYVHFWIDFYMIGPLHEYEDRGIEIRH